MSRPASPGGLINTPDAFQSRFGVSRETVEKFEAYGALLKRWQKTINLVAPSTLDAIWHRHFADSAQLAPLIPKSAERLVDLGSGAGFPGLVLAIVLAEARPRQHLFIESDSRKAAFIREAARTTGVAVDIVVDRIEKTATQRKLARFDVVTARALAPLRELCALAQPLVAQGGTCLFPKGRDAISERDEARQSWAFEDELVPSITDENARIIVLRGLVGRTEG